MKKQEIKINYYEVNTSELSATDIELKKHAEEAMEKAYAPYSKFNVGCAVRLKNGEIVTGSNQENVSFPAGVCAERTTLMYTNAKYPDVPVMEMAVCAKPDNEDLKDFISPCGVCRQTIAETENRFKQPIRILLIGREKTIIVDSIKQLLPFSFDEL